MLLSSFTLSLIIGFAAACAPHSPKAGCTPAKQEPSKKCTDLGLVCTPATITKTSVTCPTAGQFVFFDTDEVLNYIDELFCNGNQWYSRNKDPATGAVKSEKPVKGAADLNVACYMPPAAPGR